MQPNALSSAPRVVEFIAELRNITVCEGEDAVFKCVVSPEDTRVVWRLSDKQVALNEQAVISSNGLCHMLCIHNCMVSDSGRVTADAEGLVSEAELQVQGELVFHPLLVYLSQSITDIRIFNKSSITSCFCDCYQLLTNFSHA